MRAILFVVFALTFNLLKAEEVRVRIFSDKTVSSTQIRVTKGRFAWVAYSANQEVIDTISVAYDTRKALHDVRPSSSDLALNREALSLGRYSILRLVPLSDTAWFIIKGVGRERTYGGALEIHRKGGQLLLINEVDMIQYIGGVVESEVGHFTELEFFKAQAIIARTWFFANQNKHIEEGYNVKDDVSSQAYYSRAYLQNSATILQAVNETGDTILVDNAGKPILGVFHANSGGQTANAFDAWSADISYLRSHPDTFSVAGEKAFWQVTLNKEEFVFYVAQKLGLPASDPNLRVALLEYQPTSREGSFEYRGRKVKWRDVRRHFGLRSAWFSVFENGDEVLLKGRGFGHGVGMSQEGANRMAQLNFDWQSILQHYFPGTRALRFGDLP